MAFDSRAPMKSQSPRWLDRPEWQRRLRWVGVRLDCDCTEAVPWWLGIITVNPNLCKAWMAPMPLCFLYRIPLWIWNGLRWRWLR